MTEARYERLQLAVLAGLILAAVGAAVADAFPSALDEWPRLVMPIVCMPVAAIAWFGTGWFGATSRRSARALAVGLVVLTAADFGSLAHSKLAVVFDIGGAVGTAFWMRFCSVFPRGEDSEDVSLAWAAIAGVLDGGIRVLLYWDMAPEIAVYAVDVGVLLMAVLALVRGYQVVDAAGRRRLRWFVAGATLGLLSWSAQAGIPWVASGDQADALYALTSLGLVAMPVGALLGVLVDDAFGIDGRARVVSILAVTMALAAIGVFLITQWTLRPFLVARGGSQSGFVFWTLIATAGSAWLVYKALCGRLIAHFLPERHSVDRAPLVLQEALSGARDAEELAKRTTQALHSLLWFSWTEVRVRQDDGTYAQVAQHGSRDRSPAAPEGQALEIIEERAATLRCGDPSSPCIVVELGPKLSRTRLSAQERVVLGAAMTKANAGLDLLDASDALTRQRAIIASLRQTPRPRPHQTPRPISPNVDALAGTRHDLRQPVEAIRLLGELLEGSELDARSREIAEDIVRSARSMSELLDGLSVSEHSEELGSAVPLEELERSLRARFAASAARKGLEFDLALSGAVVRSHRVSLERILANLVGNAIRYTNAGSVRVRCEQDCQRPNTVLLAVVDTGEGLREEANEDAFAPYTQLANGDSEGQGLGLAIVAQLAELLQHSLVVETSAAGTRITLEVERYGALPS